MIKVRIASIPEREHMLSRTISSLRPQINKLFVALNGYDHIPNFLQEGEYELIDNSMTDAARYYGVENDDGYIFGCDDDIIYPPDYVDYMISKVEQYQSIVTLHGKSYSHSHIHFLKAKEIHRCLGDVHQDVQVEVGGTGVMAWRSDMLKIKYEDFKSPNMADIWMAKLAWGQGVKIMCVAHTRKYLKYRTVQDTIFRRERKKGGLEQTNLLRTFLNEPFGSHSA